MPNHLCCMHIQPFGICCIASLQPSTMQSHLNLEFHCMWHIVDCQNGIAPLSCRLRHSRYERCVRADMKQLNDIMTWYHDQCVPKLMVSVMLLNAISNRYHMTYAHQYYNWAKPCQLNFAFGLYFYYLDIVSVSVSPSDLNRPHLCNVGWLGTGSPWMGVADILKLRLLKNIICQSKSVNCRTHSTTEPSLSPPLQYNVH